MTLSKRTTLAAAGIIAMLSAGSLCAQNAFPSFTVETYEENARLKKENAALQIDEDTLPRSYMIVLTFSAPAESIAKIHVKAGSSSGSGNFFQGTFLCDDSGNAPAKSYYGINDSKHYIKVYLDGFLAKGGAKYYQLQLENSKGELSPAVSGVITD